VQGLAVSDDNQPERRTVLLTAHQRDEFCSAHPSSGEEVCWGPSSDEYRAAAAEHQLLVAADRKAADRLREEKERACAGLSGFDRDVSPFAHTSDIMKVEPIAADNHLEGASVLFRRMRGMTREKFQRIVDCHIAQAEELDHNVPEESFCPLNPPDVRASVRDATEGYLVDVRSTDRLAAEEVLRRAMNLTKGAPLTDGQQSP
jgi:hypothetical protein